MTFTPAADTRIAAEIATLLLDLEAVRLQPDEPFTWASGWLSPIYCDNRLILSSPQGRRKVCHAFREVFSLRWPQANVVAGVATAGIAHGILLAEALDLPYVYVRSESKGHGMRNRIEGRLAPDAKAIVVEDLVSTGGSSLQAVEALREAGATVLGLGAIFTYGFDRAEQAFRQANCPWFALSDYTRLLEEALARGVIGQDVLGRLQVWRRDPANWKG